MQYPYAEIKPEIFAPVVELQIFGEEWVSFNLFVDTGASFTIFHSETARLLGINYRKGALVFLTVGDGRQIPVYRHKLKVLFSGQEFKAIIGFSSRLGVGFHLLGREDFFENFRICFNDRDKVLETTFLESGK
ncbi:hypothetical protein HZB07_01055 [Candidatus Saganbacteria bacterium]|nr:hypothetical protein [Candidatus Saganbacteria bacterium]